MDRRQPPLRSERPWRTGTESHSPATTVGVASRYDGALDGAALSSAVADLVERHPPLRLLADSELGAPAVPEVDAAELEVTDLTGRRNPDTVVGDLIARSMAPVHGTAGRLVRFTLYRLSPRDHVLFLAAHRDIVDAEAFDIIAADLIDLYRMRVNGLDGALPLLSADYRAGITARTRGRRAPAVPRHRIDRLRGLPPGELRCLRSGAPGDTVDGAVTVYIGRRRTAALRDFAAGHGVSLFVVVLTAVEILVARHSGTELFVLGIPPGDRADSAPDEITLPATRAVPMIADCSEDPTLGQLLAGVSAETAAASLEAAQGGRAPFTMEVSLTPARPEPVLALPGLNCTPMPVPRGRLRSRLAWELVEHTATIEGVLAYQGESCDRAGARRFVGGLHRVVDDMLLGPDRRVSEIEEDLCSTNSGTT
jgi:condensation domain-containing protein